MARSGSEGAILDGGSLGRQGSSFREELESAEKDVAACLDPSAPLPGADRDGGGQAEEGPLSPSPEKALLTDEERKARRMTYPAGRIYHLVPARLVFGALTTPLSPPLCGALRWSDARTFTHGPTTGHLQQLHALTSLIGVAHNWVDWKAVSVEMMRPLHLSTGEEGDKARQRRSDLRASSSMGNVDLEELEVAGEAHLRQRKAASPPAKGSMPSSLYEGVVGYDSPTMGKVCLLSNGDAKQARGHNSPLHASYRSVSIMDRRDWHLVCGRLIARGLKQHAVTLMQLCMICRIHMWSSARAARKEAVPGALHPPSPQQKTMSSWRMFPRYPCLLDV